MKDNTVTQTVLWPLFVIAAVTVLLFVEPAYANDELKPVQGLADGVMNVFTGPLARTLAIIAIAGLGLIAFSGRLRWQTALSVIVGIAVVFGAVTIVDWIEDAAG